MEMDWLKERGLDGDTTTPQKKTPKELRETGYCLDNISSGQSLIKDAGRGAFSTRQLDEGYNNSTSSTNTIIKIKFRNDKGETRWNNSSIDTTSPELLLWSHQLFITTISI